NDFDFTVEQAVPYGMLRTSLFQSDVRDSIYTQTNILVTPNVTNVQNVDRVRTRGIELAYSGQNVLQDLGVRGVDV
ncbi:TonB-dependent receptor domain-containing protein, partial [Salmonella enterica]